MRLQEEISKATRSYIEKSSDVIVGTVQYRMGGKPAGTERTGKPEMPDREEFIEVPNVVLPQ